MVAMQEPTLLVLTALADRPLHGYGVMQEVLALSAGRVRLRAGTLYGALDRLAEQELIEVEREETIDGRLRRYYRLTEFGAQALTAEVERLRATADAAAQRLRRRGVPDGLGGLAGGATMEAL